MKEDNKLHYVRAILILAIDFSMNLELNFFTYTEKRYSNLSLSSKIVYTSNHVLFITALKLFARFYIMIYSEIKLKI